VIADLAEIVSYIAQDNSDAAAAVGNNLLDAALSLQSTPYKGSLYQRLTGIRKLEHPSLQDILSCSRRRESYRDPSLLALGTTGAEALSSSRHEN